MHPCVSGRSREIVEKWLSHSQSLARANSRRRASIVTVANQRQHILSLLKPARPQPTLRVILDRSNVIWYIYVCTPNQTAGLGVPGLVRDWGRIKGKPTQYLYKNHTSTKNNWSGKTAHPGRCVACTPSRARPGSRLPGTGPSVEQCREPLDWSRPPSRLPRWVLRYCYKAPTHNNET